MKKQTAFAMLACASIAVGASCSFPTYNITVTSGAGGAGGASSAIGNGGASASGATTASGGGSSSTDATTSATSSSDATSSSNATSSAASGGCTTDVDGDGYVSMSCPEGTDCADGDILANPEGDYHGAAIKNPPAGTLPYDFNCDGAEEAETPVLSCFGCPTTEGFQAAVACGASAPLGTCTGLPPLCNFAAKSPAVSKTQRCK